MARFLIAGDLTIVGYDEQQLNLAAETSPHSQL